MPVCMTCFLLMTALLWGGLVTSDRETVTIGVILEVEVDELSVSRNVRTMIDSYRKTSTQWLPDVILKWVYMNSTRPTQVLKTENDSRVCSEKRSAGVKPPTFDEYLANSPTCDIFSSDGSYKSSRYEVCQMVDNCTQALISALRCPQRKTVSSIAHAVRVPHVNVHIDPCSSKTPGEFNLLGKSNINDLVPALVAIGRAADHEQLRLEFNNPVDYSTKQRIFLDLSSAGFQSGFINVPNANKTDIMELLPSGMTWVVLMQGLTLRKERNELTVDNSILLVIPKPTCPLTLADQTFESMTFLESQIARAALLLYKALHHMMNGNTDWETEMPCFRYTLSHDGYTTVIQTLNRIYDDAGACAPCDNQPRRGGYDLYGVLTAPHPRLTPVGHWTEKDGLTINPSHPEVTNRLFPNKLTDFGGVTLRVVVHGDSHPYANRTRSGNKSHYGLAVDMIEDLANRLNFRFTLIEPPDGRVGSKFANGSYSGMVGVVERGEADLGCASLTVTAERSAVVDFTTAYQQDSLGILTPKSKEAPHQFQVFKPFKLEIWLAIFTSIFIASAACVLFSVFNRIYKETDRKPHMLLERSIKENIFLIISSYFEQGPTFHPTSVPARCFLTFWFIFSMMIMSMYTAHLAAVLTVSTPVRPINTLQDLADRTDMGVVALAGTITLPFLQQSQKPAYRAVAKRLKTVDTSYEFLRGVLEGTDCAISDRLYLEFEAARSCGKMRIADEKMNGFSLGFIIAKNSPYKDAFDINIQKMVESGLFDQLLRKWMTSPTNCTKKGKKAAVARNLGLDTLGGVFIIYGLFIVVAVLALLLKITYFVVFPHFKHRCTSGADLT